MAASLGQQVDSKSNTNINKQQQPPPLCSSQAATLVDRLIEGQLEWRQLVREANPAGGSLEQLSALQIKRQEVIHELVQTERHHCLTLALMRQVYLSGLRQLNESRSLRESGANLNAASQLAGSKQQQQQHQHQHGKLLGQLESLAGPCNGADLIDLERLFPALEDLIQAHELFFAHLRLRLVDSCTRICGQGGQAAPLLGLVGPLGELLCDQFRLRRPSAAAAAGQSAAAAAAASAPASPDQPVQPGAGSQAQCGKGQKLLQAYAKFCGQHYDSSRYYKQLMQTDKGFKQFIETCNKQNAACRQRGIPECNLLVTQRLTKYPLLIEQLIKTSKDDQDEEAKLRDALRECKALLAELNHQLAMKESFERLLDIYAQFCPKSYTIYNQRLKFTKHDLLQHKRLRQLVHSDGQIRIWSATRRKLFQVLCLVLNDIIVFLRIESTSSSSSSSHTTATSAQTPSNPPACSGPVTSSTNPLGPSHLHQLYPQLPAALTSAEQVGGELYVWPPPPPPQQPQSAPGTEQAAPGGQCALLNVVTHAFNAGVAHPTLHLSNLTPTCLLAHNPPSSSHSGPLGSSAGGINMKYYFANIDNKPSVISLSKLLIREKAVNDAEPRIYLISSSPRQPEMYELAFVSKRHQSSFVEKLKGCIEQHNRNGEYFDDDEDEYEDEELSLSHGQNLNDCPLNGDDEGARATSFNNLCTSRYCQSAACAAANRSDDDDENDSEDGDDDDEDDDDVDYADDDDQEEELFEDAIQCCPSGSDRKRKTERRYRTSTIGDLEFELDIEQDVVLPSDQTGETPERADSAGEQSMFVYSTPPACKLAAEGREVAVEEGRALEGAATATTSLTLFGGEVVAGKGEGGGDKKAPGISCSSGGSESETDERLLGSHESGLSERAKDSLDEAAPRKHKLRCGRRRRVQRPRQVSNQSSSSSEAAHRQAIKLISSGSLSGNKTGPTSSEHEEEFDSGRGHDDSSSAASTTSNSIEPHQAELSVSATTSEQELPRGGGGGGGAAGKQEASQDDRLTGSGAGALTIQNATSKREKLLDLRLLKGGISLSTSSITSTLMGSITGLNGSCSSSANTPSGTMTSRANGSDRSSATEPSVSPRTASGSNNNATIISSSSCASSTASGSSAASARPPNKSNLVKCSSILSKSNCSFVKQRKLSTVSTMSSQLKLISKLKSGLVIDGHLCSHCHCCADQAGLSAHQSAAAAAAATAAACGSQQSTLSKQMRQQLRRSSFVPEQKLEELRDLRIQLDKDKEEWQAKFDRMQEQLLNERRELDLAREKLKQDRQQVANEREQLYRKLDLLKEKGILLSPSHKVIITTPELRFYPQNGADFNATPYQQQQHTNNQRQPLQILNNNHQSAIRIMQQQHHLPQQQSSICQQQALNNTSYPLDSATDSLYASRSQRQSTNLFIQSSATAGKVPLHLSEGPSRPSRFLGALSGTLLGNSFHTGKSGVNMESQLI